MIERNEDKPEINDVEKRVDDMKRHFKNAEAGMQEALSAMYRVYEAVLDEFRHSKKAPEGVLEMVKGVALRHEALDCMAEIAFLYKNMAKVLSGRDLTDEDRKGVIYFAMMVSNLKNIPKDFPEFDQGAVDEALQNKYAWRTLPDQGDDN